MEQKKEFEIFAFSSPYYTEESYRDFAECGFTMPFLDWNEGPPGTEAFDRVMDYCDKYQLKAMPMLIGGIRYIPKEKDWDVKRHSSFYGLHVADEPHDTKDIDDIARMLDEFKEDYGNEYCFFVNLAPNCVLHPEKYEGRDGFLGVQEYIDYYSETVLDKVEGRKIFSFDFYPIYTKYGKLWLRREWLKHMEIFARKAADNDYEFFVYLASTGGWHDDPATEQIGLCSAEIKGLEYLRLQGFVDMCYGATGIGFFTYKDQPHFDYQALVGRDCKHDLYYDSKMAISEFKYLNSILEKYKWQCCNTYAGKQHSEYAAEAFAMLLDNKNNFECLTVDACEKDLVVGQFKNQETGEYAYAFVTYAFPENVGKNQVQLTFKEETTLRIQNIVDKTEEVVKADKLVLTLQECQVKVVIVERTKEN